MQEQLSVKLYIAMHLEKIALYNVIYTLYSYAFRKECTL